MDHIFSIDRTRVAWPYGRVQFESFVLGWRSGKARMLDVVERKMLARMKSGADKSRRENRTRNVAVGFVHKVYCSRPAAHIVSKWLHDQIT